MFAMADICVSRAGANAICELLALRKPNLLIPLSANASRGDQILNAESFEHQGFSEVLSEENLAPSILLPMIQKIYNNRDKYIAAMEKSEQRDAFPQSSRSWMKYRNPSIRFTFSRMTAGDSGSHSAKCGS